MKDDFFELVGDAVLAKDSVVVARKDFNIDTPPEAVFRLPSLLDLAAAMRKSTEHRDQITPFSLLPDASLKHVLVDIAMKECGISSTTEIEDIYPCTPMQEGIMAVSLMNPRWDYTADNLYRLPDAISIEKLVDSWNRVVEINAILRTRIIQTNEGSSYQVVIKGGLSWLKSTCLDDFGQNNARRLIRLGDPLMQLMLFQEREGNYFGLSLHHTIYDGYSYGQMLSQVEAIYHGDEYQSKPFNIFVEFLLDQDRHAAEEYWRAALADFPGSTFPSPPPSWNRDCRQLSIRKMNRSMLVDIPKNMEATTASLISCSWALTMSQYSGSKDVVFGTTYASRSVPVTGIDEIAGPTIATVPLRLKFHESIKIRDMLNSCHEVATKGKQFGQIGLKQIASLGPGAATACKFHCLLVVQPPDSEHAWTIFDHFVQEYSKDTSESYILTLQVKLGRRGLFDIEAAYDQSIIQDLFMNKVLQQFEHNLNEVSGGLDKSLQELTVLNANDFRTIDMWNCHMPEAVDCCIHDIVYRQTLSKLSTLAVKAWDGNLTYEQLHHSYTALASYIQTFGAQPGMYVMIYMAKSVWVIIAVMAVLRAGCAFVLLDLAQPNVRLKKICDDTNAKLVLTSKSCLKSATALGLQVVMVDIPSDEEVQLQLKEPAVTANHIAYAVFTSGSTGEAKGVIIPHRAFLTSAILNGAAQFIHENSRVLMFSSFTFDQSIAEILYTLVHGGCVCIPRQEDCLNDLENVMNTYEITWAALTPSMARVLDPSTLTTLRTLSLGGESLTKIDVERWADRVQLMNSYGPAECSVDTTIQPDISRSSDPSNIGRGVAALCWITDPNDHHKLQPIGAIGELVVEGPILAQGYLKDPEKTAASFVDNPDWLSHLRPQSHKKNPQVYRTGDLVQYCSQGNGDIRYIGRKDNQVKLRGQRIELGEVEHHLRVCLPQAIEIVVEIVTLSDSGAEPTLAAFILFEGGCKSIKDSFLAPISPSVLQLAENAERVLRSRLPGFMIPTLFLPITRVLYTLSGKIDRRALREQAAKLSRSNLQAYRRNHTVRRPPATMQESQLQSAIAHVLKLPLDEICMEDNFFELGGDSITAIRLVSFMRGLECTLEVANILKLSRLEDLAASMHS